LKPPAGTSPSDVSTVNTVLISQKLEPLQALLGTQQPEPVEKSELLRTVTVWLAPTSAAPGRNVKGWAAKHPPETVRVSRRTPVTLTPVVPRFVNVTTAITSVVHAMFIVPCGDVTLADN